MSNHAGVVSCQNAPHYQWGRDASGWHLLNTDQLSVIEERVSAGDREQRHYHRHAQQFFYVLQGVATLELEGRLLTLTAGEGVHVPARCAHQLINNELAELRFLVISNPRSHGDRAAAPPVGSERN